MDENKKRKSGLQEDGSFILVDDFEPEYQVPDKSSDQSGNDKEKPGNSDNKQE